MSEYDRRLIPANEHIIADHLDLPAKGRQVIAGQPATVSCAVADLLRAPDGARDRQLLLGERITVYETRNGYAFVQAQKDGYVGYVRTGEIGPEQKATHRVKVRMTHAYSAPDFKSQDSLALSHGSLLAVIDDKTTTDRFVETTIGFVPRAHIAPLEAVDTDLVTVAESLLGTPYLWGGNSSFGIDCSGLIQAAFTAAGHSCPGDSDQQEKALGRLLATETTYTRGDLLFWKGHVALVVDPERLIHANVHHMAVAYENITEAITRISAQGDGPVTAHKRLIH